MPSKKRKQQNGRNANFYRLLAESLREMTEIIRKGREEIHRKYPDLFKPH